MLLCLVSGKYRMMNDCTYRSRRLSTGGTDLHTDVRSGNEDLGDGHAVVRDEAHSEEVSHVRIVVLRVSSELTLKPIDSPQPCQH